MYVFFTLKAMFPPPPWIRIHFWIRIRIKADADPGSLPHHCIFNTNIRTVSSSWADQIRDIMTELGWRQFLTLRQATTRQHNHVQYEVLCDMLKYTYEKCFSLLYSKCSFNTIFSCNVRDDLCLAVKRCQIVATVVACAQLWIEHKEENVKDKHQCKSTPCVYKLTLIELLAWIPWE